VLCCYDFFRFESFFVVAGCCYISSFYEEVHQSLCNFSSTVVANYYCVLATILRLLPPGLWKEKIKKEQKIFYY